MRYLKVFETFKKVTIEDIMWCIVDIFDEFNMTQKENVNIKWTTSNSAYHYNDMFPNDCNVWRYNNNDQILIICPLEKDNYKIWHNILPPLEEAKRFIKKTLNVNLKIELSIYQIGLIRITME